MNKIAVFPGSFDPITKGHIDVVMRSLDLFEKVIIALGVNSKKNYLFPLEKRIDWIEHIFMNEQKVEVQHFEGLTIDFCKKVKARYILRGLRSAADFEYERVIAQLNHSMYNEIDTVFIASKPEYSHISSTIVREILINGGDASQFLPGTLAGGVEKEMER